MSDSMLVRIKPTNQRAMHWAHGVRITKDGGWHRVPREIASKLALEVMN